MISTAFNPAFSHKAQDDTLRSLNFEVSTRNRNQDMELAEAFGLSPVGGYSVDESAANRHQDRYFHLLDETMLSTRIIGLDLDPNTEWLITAPDGFPIQAVNSLKYVRRILKFDQSGWEVSPEEGPDRTMQSYRGAEQGTLTRKGKQIEISGDSLATEEGRAFLEMQKRQVQITLKIELCVSALHTMLLSRNNRIDDLIDQGLAQKSFRAIIEQKFSEFAAFQKNSDITPLLTNYITVLQSREGRMSADFVVMPAGLEFYVRGIEEELDYEKNGPAALAAKRKMPLSVTTIGPTKLRIRKSMKVLNPDIGPIKMDPLVSSKTIGMLYRMFPFSKMKYTDDKIKYDRMHRSIKLMDLDEDAKFTIKLEDAVEACLSFLIPDAESSEPFDANRDERLDQIDMFQNMNPDPSGMAGSQKAFTRISTIGSMKPEFFTADALSTMAEKIKEATDKTDAARFKNPYITKLYTIAGGSITGLLHDRSAGIAPANIPDQVHNFLRATDAEFDAYLAAVSSLPGGPALTNKISATTPLDIAGMLRLDEPMAYGVFKPESAAGVNPAMNFEEMHDKNLELLNNDQMTMYTDALNHDGIDKQSFIANVNRALISDDASSFQASIAAPLSTIFSANPAETKKPKGYSAALSKLNSMPQELSTESVSPELSSSVGFFASSEIEAAGKDFQPMDITGNPVAAPQFFQLHDMATNPQVLTHIILGVTNQNKNTELQISAPLRDLPKITDRSKAYNLNVTFAASAASAPVANRRETNFITRIRQLGELHPADSEILGIGLLISSIAFSKNNLIGLIKANVHFPFAAAVVFPHVRVQTATLIVGSSNAGFTAIYNPNAWKGADSSHKKLIIHFTVSTGAIVTAPQKFVIIDDVAITHYYNGHGSKAFDAESLAEFKNNGYMWNDEQEDTPSWYTMLLPTNQSLPSIIDVKGYFSDNIPSNVNDNHFVTDYAAVNKLWDTIGPNINPYSMPDYDGSVMRYPQTNTICIQGTQWNYNLERRDFKDRLPGTKCAFGANMYPGMTPVINSLQKTFKDPMLADYNDCEIDVN